MTRKSFEDLPAKENPHFAEDGLLIYKLMRKKYPEKDIEAIDNILNGICASLSILINTHVSKDDRPYLIQLIHKALTKNINNA
jgi:hypothetical protein